MGKDKCYNGGKRHKFEPRYDEVPRKVQSFEADWITSSQMRSLLVYTVYVRDVCVWCGKTIEREVI